MNVNAREKTELGTRLKGIAGQVTGIRRMIENDRDLPDVITQVRAVRAALGAVTNILVAFHVEECATEALTAANDRQRREIVSELVRVAPKKAP